MPACMLLKYRSLPQLHYSIPVSAPCCLIHREADVNVGVSMCDSGIYWSHQLLLSVVMVTLTDDEPSAAREYARPPDARAAPA